jgi:hypothetical protein
MRRAWMIACAVFACFVAVVTTVHYRSTHPRVPPPLDATDCSVPKGGELPNARFEREGGRTTRYVKVWRQGTFFTVENVTQGRDMARYGVLEVADPEPRTASDTAREPFLAQARTFIWEHWRDKKRGYLILTTSSVDATASSHVFIERDETGRWRVYWRIVRPRSRIDDAPTTYGVRWVRSGNRSEPDVPLGETDTPDPLAQRLQFRDSCGKWEGAF